MGRGADDLHGDSGSTDAEDLMNPRQGFFVEPYDSKLVRAYQVWLRFQIDGVVQEGWCVWTADYDEKTAGKGRGRQEAMLLLFRQIAHTLNSGITLEEIHDVVAELADDCESRPLLSIDLPEPWFYWASSFDCDGIDETTPVCTHYFVQPDSDQCLVWQEDTYMEVVPCESVGLHWEETEAATREEFAEEAIDVQEATPGAGRADLPRATDAAI